MRVIVDDVRYDVRFEYPWIDKNRHSICEITRTAKEFYGATVTDTVALGDAKCRRDETFVRTEGRDIAYMRALKELSWFDVPREHRKAISTAYDTRAVACRWGVPEWNIRQQVLTYRCAPPPSNSPSSGRLDEMSSDDIVAANAGPDIAK